MKENQAVRLIISAVCHQPHFIFPDGGNIPLKHSVLFAHPQTFFFVFFWNTENTTPKKYLNCRIMTSNSEFIHFAELLCD